MAKEGYLQIDWDTVPLGEYPDRVLAEQLRCSKSTVEKKRAGRGIPGFGSVAPRKRPPNPGKIALVVGLKQLYLNASAKQVSGATGVSKKAVQKIFREHDLPMKTGLRWKRRRSKA